VTAPSGARGVGASIVAWRREAVTTSASSARPPATPVGQKEPHRRAGRRARIWRTGATASTTTTCLLGPLRAGRQQTRGAAGPPRTRARRSSRARVPRRTRTSGRAARSKLLHRPGAAQVDAGRRGHRIGAVVLREAKEQRPEQADGRPRIIEAIVGSRNAALLLTPNFDSPAVAMVARLLSRSGHIASRDRVGDIPIAGDQRPGTVSSAAPPQRPDRLCICNGSIPHASGGPCFRRSARPRRAGASERHVAAVVRERQPRPSVHTQTRLLLCRTTSHAANRRCANACGRRHKPLEFAASSASSKPRRDRAYARSGKPRRRSPWSATVASTRRRGVSATRRRRLLVVVQPGSAVGAGEHHSIVPSKQKRRGLRTTLPRPSQTMRGTG
jgi:hypothetical protein